MHFSFKQVLLQTLALKNFCLFELDSLIVTSAIDMVTAECAIFPNFQAFERGLDCCCFDTYICHGLLNILLISLCVINQIPRNVLISLEFLS